VTCRTSRQFNFSLHVKINHIEFEDKFLIKPTRIKKIFVVGRLLKKCSNKYGKERTLNDSL